MFVVRDCVSRFDVMCAGSDCMFASFGNMLARCVVLFAYKVMFTVCRVMLAMFVMFVFMFAWCYVCFWSYVCMFGVMLV